MTHPKLPSWTDWLDHATEGETQTQIGDRIGVSRATVARWAHRRIDPNTVLAIARAYRVDPIQGLLASGWLKPEDLNNGGMLYMVSYAPTRMLVNELHRRLGGQ
jgi:transcriptional regulator with XRE-family HTH domain